MATMSDFVKAEAKATWGEDDSDPFPPLWNEQGQVASSSFKSFTHVAE